MPKLIVSCDEKWPIFNLEVPEEGQKGNCFLPEDLYRDYLLTVIKYQKMQKILKVYYDSAQRKSPEDIT